MANIAETPENMGKENTPECDQTDFFPPEATGVLNEIPEPQRKAVMQFMSAGFSMIRHTSPEGEISKKITSEHITTMLETQNKDLEYSFKETKNKMIFFVVILVIIVAAVLAIIKMLKDGQPEIMEKILTVLISGALGAAGGYGFGVKKRNEE